MATIDDFKKLDLRVARILEVQDHPNADKLYVLTVDAGGVKKKIVAGIRTYYTKEALLGKYCVLVNNLDPVTLRGVESQGMLLAAKDAQQLSIVTIEKDIALGSPIS
ncbi:MAG: methionine--tRNA ligase subunit beta [Candidatus Omnitrophota bacterium]